MKYRIKNPEIEKAVRGLFKNQEGFEHSFNEACKHYFNFNQNFVKVYATGDYTVSGCWIEVGVAKSDIEEVVEYNPKKWNEYSKVKPPENVWMRCEMRTIDSIRKVGAIFQDGEWRNHEGYSYRTSGWYCVRFKPWDDEGE